MIALTESEVKQVLPNDQWVWVCADYKQAEAMVVAWKGPVDALKAWFRGGEDVHTNLARLMARVVQEYKFVLPNNLFRTKAWNEYTKKDPERQLAKSCVHGCNYGLGVIKFALMTGLPVPMARVVMDVYFGLLPDIKNKYQAGIRLDLEQDRTMWTPLGRRLTFYDVFSEDLYRACYAGYPQATVGDLTVECMCGCAEAFEQDIPENVIVTPERIAQMGLDVQMNVHDSVNVVCPNSKEAIDFTCRTILKNGLIPMEISGDTLTIPMDFKVGRDLGTAKDYEFSQN